MSAAHTETPADLVIRPPEPRSASHRARPALLGHHTVTYGELADAVHRTAAHLRALGACRGERVVIWMDKRPEYVLAVLATLAAGCIYVPVDGAQPIHRVQAILDQTQPIVLCTDQRHLAIITSVPDAVHTVFVVSDNAAPRTRTESTFAARIRPWSDFTELPTGACEPEVLGSDDAAAILYTSGSSGAPKGVTISHRNLATFRNWACAQFDIDAEDVFANHASFNFDLSTFDVFVALAVGAAVWIISDEQAHDAMALAAGIRDHAVTVWYSVPSVLTLLTGSGAVDTETLRGLRYVFFAGEVYPKPRLRELAAMLPADTSLYNLYGPTETNVCTYHLVTPADLGTDDPLPIGLPRDDVTVRIVDAAGLCVESEGAIGELVVEGDCVTPGYWGHDGTPSAEQHRRHTHSTGDLVCYDNGRLVFHGRLDRMVKISGYRVELGEIEAAVLCHPAVEAAAMVTIGSGADPRLHLFYTTRADAPAPTLVDIKRHCARYLPRYMVPKAATRLLALPRNSNGKVDFQALAAL